MNGRRRLWAIGLALVLGTGALLRLADLERKPMHHDEGVNGFFLQKLARDGEYRYDPHNYHGPTLYYLAWLTTRATGLTTFGVRLSTALAGLGCLGLLLALGPRVPRGARLGAAALLAVSPGAVYFSRYFIHESLVLLFTLGVVAAWWRWQAEPRRMWLLLVAASAALLVATKETGVLHLGVLLIAWGLSWVLALAGPEGDPPAAPLPAWRDLGLAGLVFAAIHVTLYSSFFTNWDGVADSVRTYLTWHDTGTSAHVNPVYQHLSWLWEAEPVQVLAGGLGVLVAVASFGRRVETFTALWMLGLLALYSAVPYKTPWLGLNVILPACVLGGLTLDALARGLARLTGRGIWLLVPLTAMPLVYAGWQAFDLSFRQHSDETRPYVYAHTQPGFLEMVGRIDSLASASGRGFETPITVTSPEHWPLAWYLREYPGAGFYGEIPETISGAIVVGHGSQDATLARKLGSSYRRLGEYPLRPGVELVLYALWELDARAMVGSNPRS